MEDSNRQAKVPGRIPETQRLEDYLDGVVHRWTAVLSMLGFTLVPIFYLLDLVMMPTELLGRFAWYRGVTTVLVVVEYVVLRKTKASHWSYVHGYFFSIVVGGMIALMTTDLGGFHSTYYAGLNLVLVAVCLLLPWNTLHSGANSLIILGLYIGLNLIFPTEGPLEFRLVLNNFYFLVSMAVIAVAINAVKHRLVIQEFVARQELQAARDALWGEMEVAKHIQTALLPQVSRIGTYEVAATMVPADEVGGDYYDIFETADGEQWVNIGDVSGHGVESGLIMMMAQTSLLTAVSSEKGLSPAAALARTNTVLRRNIRRLDVDRYMTITAIRLEPDKLQFSGRHQPLLIWRAASRTVERVPTTGTWLGIMDELERYLAVEEVPIAEGDAVLLFTDGVTEAIDEDEKMYGLPRLEKVFGKLASRPPDEVIHYIIEDVRAHMAKQDDDLTMVVLARRSS